MGIPIALENTTRVVWFWDWVWVFMCVALLSLFVNKGISLTSLEFSVISNVSTVFRNLRNNIVVFTKLRGSLVRLF